MPKTNIKELILALVVSVSLLGLFVIAIIDVDSRSVFLDVAQVSIGVFMGYLIPNSQ